MREHTKKLQMNFGNSASFSLYHHSHLSIQRLIRNSQMKFFSSPRKKVNRRSMLSKNKKLLESSQAKTMSWPLVSLKVKRIYWISCNPSYQEISKTYKWSSASRLLSFGWMQLRIGRCVHAFRPKIYQSCFTGLSKRKMLKRVSA